MITYVDVQELSSEFASLTQARIDPFIARATRRVNEGFWGDLFDDAVLYLTAHLLSQAENAAGGGSGGGASGPVTGKTVGPLSVTYANLSSSSTSGAIPAEYARTSYGQTYWAMLQTLRFKAAPRAI